MVAMRANGIITDLTFHLPPVSLLHAETANSLMKSLHASKVTGLHLGHLTCETGVGLLPLVALRLTNSRSDM